MNKTTKQLLEENNQREKELSPDNQKVLTDIVAYLRGSSTPILQQEQVRRDITEMLLEGEVRGQSAQTIIGQTIRPSAMRFWRSCPGAVPESGPSH